MAKRFFVSKNHSSKIKYMIFELKFIELSEYVKIFELLILENNNNNFSH